MDVYVPVGSFVICKCGIKLAKRTDWFKFEMLKFRSETVENEYDGQLRISCKRCNFQAMFASVKEGVQVA